MVRAVFVVGSSLVDSKSCASLPSCNLSSENLILQKYSIGRKHVPRLGLNSSFLDYSSTRALLGSKNLRKLRKNRRQLVVVDEMAGQYEDNFEDVEKQLLDYFTYEAVRTILNQLYEMNPPQYR